MIGEAVRIGLVDGPSTAQIAVPRDALVLRDPEVYVYKVLDNATAKRILVQAGTGRGEFITITGDLAAGDQVVIRGAERLKDGQPVRILGQRSAADTDNSVFSSI